MREILFRGKVVQDCNYKGKFIHGDFAYGNCIRPIENVGDDIIESYGLYDELAFVEVEPETVGQFIGLLDKNGNKIFEGDILKTVYTDELVCVNYNDKNTLFEISFKNYSETFGLNYYSSDVEIVGNIHDNKEMLK